MTRLALTSIAKSYDHATGPRRILDDVSLGIEAGEAVGLVGESGSGKSTLLRCALGLVHPDAGTVTYDGIDLRSASPASVSWFRREVQVVFQDPYASLNPRMTVGDLVGEGLLIHASDRPQAVRRDLVVEMLERVGLGAADMPRYPRSFSGGQRQRIAIARALVIGPRLLLCDEPVSALDVSVQAQVLNLLADLQRTLGLGILFVAHDLAVVRHLCSRVAVLNHGRIVETGATATVFGAPRDPYTRALLAAVPIPDPVVARQQRAERRRARLAGTSDMSETGD